MFAQNKLIPKSGRILIAEPFMADGYFRRTVVLVVEHNEKGTIGFILNRPLDFQLHETLTDFPGFNSKTFFGGPVQRDHVFFIHTLGDQIEGSFPIGNGLWWLGDFDQVKRLIRLGEIGVNEIRFFIGYSGWEPGQIEKEMEEKSWYVSKTDLDFIFSYDADNMWTKALEKMGNNFAAISKFPENPSLN
jgi:putative transcriptional regulator